MIDAIRRLINKYFGHSKRTGEGAAGYSNGHTPVDEGSPGYSDGHTPLDEEMTGSGGGGSRGGGSTGHN